MNIYNLRPSTAIVNALRSEKQAAEELLLRLKNAPSDERDQILDSLTVTGSTVQLAPASRPSLTIAPAQRGKSHATDEDDTGSSDEDLDVLPFLSIGEGGKVDSFGPSSIYQGLRKPIASSEYPVTEHVRNQLIANAVLQRQREYDIHRWQEIDGVPVELALHLLDLHWNRQHHSFLLTYRPAIMRDLINHGPYCSRFLLNAIFACSSKYSQRLEVRDDISDHHSSGRRFFARCDQLLAEESLLNYSSIATLVGLLLLGATYNALGQASKGWLYTGYALRMVFDLGLHLDSKETTANAEDLEIRRRVFWGAFISDKLQSLYLGRPMGIHLTDVHVSRNFMDTMEEKELWTPYVDPLLPAETSPALPIIPIPIYSVSTFQKLCLLSRIMTKIINRFYVVGATAANARASLESIDNALRAWKQSLPPELTFEPWDELTPPGTTANTSPSPTTPTQTTVQTQTPITPLSSTSRPPYRPRPAPNIMILNAVYHSLVILLHRPFISDGHLRSAVAPAAPATSWHRCSAAARRITAIACAYQASYTLRGSAYLLSYCVYVACTIHVRNAAATVAAGKGKRTDVGAEGSGEGGETGGGGGEHSASLAASLRCLDEMTLPNAGVSKPANIIRNLMVTNGLKLSAGKNDVCPFPSMDLGPLTRPEPQTIHHYTPLSHPSLDLDAILRMFPPRPPPPAPEAPYIRGMQPFNPADDPSFGFHHQSQVQGQTTPQTPQAQQSMPATAPSSTAYVPEDLLYGFMEGDFEPEPLPASLATGEFGTGGLFRM